MHLPAVHRVHLVMRLGDLGARNCAHNLRARRARGVHDRPASVLQRALAGEYISVALSREGKERERERERERCTKGAGEEEYARGRDTHEKTLKREAGGGQQRDSRERAEAREQRIGDAAGETERERNARVIQG